MRTYERSASLRASASPCVPGGVNSHFRLGVRPEILVFDHGDGAELVDVDGNRYVDYYLGMGPMILGHTPPDVIEAVCRQVARGVLFAGQSEVEYAAASLVAGLVPCAESVRFGSSGSEVIQAALRLARAATGRRTVLKFEGHYHGWFDNVYWSVAPDLDAAGPVTAPRCVSQSHGQLDSAAQGVDVLPWNDLEALRARLRRGDVAAVIMEPVMFNNGGILPVDGYLAGVRQACDESGAVLVFDEVITGFRVGPGGAQGYYGVTPDLATLGKAIANGYPVAALVGRRDLMDHLSTGQVVHGGTYNAQAAGMAATVATLTRLTSPEAYSEIADVGGQLMNGLDKLFAEAGLPAQVVGFPAVFQVRLGSAEVRDYRTLLSADRARYQDIACELVDHGVRALARGTWFLSSAHTSRHVEQTLDAVSAVLDASG